MDFKERAQELFGKERPTNSSNGDILDVEAYLDAYGVAHSVKPQGDKTIFALDHCVFDSSHTSNDAAVIQHSTGQLAYHCFHDSCSGKGWKDARLAISGTDSLAPFMPGYKQHTGKRTPGAKLYHAQEVNGKTSKHEQVFIVPNEQQADVIRGFNSSKNAYWWGTATTVIGGLEQWHAGLAHHFNGAEVVIMGADGRTAETIAKDVQGAAKWVKVIELPGVVGDNALTEWLRGDGSVRELYDIVRVTPKWTPVKEWPEPEQIEMTLPPVMPLLDEMIPRPFLPLVKDEAHRMSVPPEYIAVPLIVVCGSLIGTACRIRPKKRDDWSVVPNLWGGIIGPPSRLKSPAMDVVVKKLLGRLEAEAAEEHQDEMASFVDEKRKAELSKSLLEQDFKAALKKERSGS